MKFKKGPSFQSIVDMYWSLRRNWMKIAAMALIGHIFLALVDTVPQTLGLDYAPLFRGFGLVMWAAAVGFLLQCLIDPHISTQDLVNRMRESGNVSAGLFFIGRCIMFAVVFLLMATASRAAEPPAAALPKLPILKEEAKLHWAELKPVSFWQPRSSKKPASL